MARFRRATAMELRGLYGALNQGLSPAAGSPDAGVERGAPELVLGVAASRYEVWEPFALTIAYAGEREAASVAEPMLWLAERDVSTTALEDLPLPAEEVPFVSISTHLASARFLTSLFAPDEIDLAAEVALKIDPERLAWCRRFRRDPTRWRRCLLGQLSTDNG